MEQPGPKSPQSPSWVADADAPNCHACERPFQAFVCRRHHCRACGQAFCDACTSARKHMRRFGYDGLQRVCEECAAPQVTQCSRVPTQGGELVLTGLNLGAEGDSVSVTAGGEPCGNVRLLQAEGEPDDVCQLRCSAEPGAGVDVPVEVEVEGRRSVAPASFSYEPPEIETPQPMPTGGGELLIHGRNLGARASDVRVIVDGTVCEPVQVTRPHSDLFVATGPGGVGSAVPLAVVVGGQRAEVSLQFEPPSVMTTSNPPFEGGDVALEGFNFGASIETLRVLVNDRLWPATAVHMIEPHRRIVLDMPPCQDKRRMDALVRLEVADQACEVRVRYSAPVPVAQPLPPRAPRYASMDAAAARRIAKKQKQKEAMARQRRGASVASPGWGDAGAAAGGGGPEPQPARSPVVPDLPVTPLSEPRARRDFARSRMQSDGTLLRGSRGRGSPQRGSPAHRHASSAGQRGAWGTEPRRRSSDFDDAISDSEETLANERQLRAMFGSVGGVPGGAPPAFGSPQGNALPALAVEHVLHARELDPMLAASGVFPTPSWVDGNFCQVCSSPFSLLLRQHHCRACGGVCCDPCSDARLIKSVSTASGNTLGWPYSRPVRVCNACWTNIQLRNGMKMTLEFLRVLGERLEADEVAGYEDEIRCALAEGRCVRETEGEVTQLTGKEWWLQRKSRPQR